MSTPISVVGPHAGTIPARGVLALNNPAGGVVAFDCPQPARWFTSLAQQLFIALGQPTTAAGGRTRTTRDHLPLLTVNLLARNITDVIIDNAQHCSAAPATQLLQTLLSADCRTWLVLHPPIDPKARGWLTAWPHRRVSWNVARRTLQRPTPEAAPITASPFPKVPTDEFPWFLEAAQNTLCESESATVTRAYRQVGARVNAHLSLMPTSEAALAQLRRELHDATNIHHAITICRATAAGAFRHGVLVTADRDRLTASLPAEAWFTARHHIDWDELHRYRRPEHAALGVLSALGLATAELAALTVADAEQLAPQLPESARCHLRRLQLHRDAAGAQPNDPLLTLADGRAVSERWVRETLSELGRTLSAPASRQRRRPHRDPDHRWAARLGIRARKFT